MGLVPIGSLGESATLNSAEKRKVMETCVKAVGDRVPAHPGHRGTFHGRGGEARAGRESDRLQRLDGAAPVRLQHRLARNESARTRGDRGNRSSMYATRKPDRLQNRFPAAAHPSSSPASFRNLHAVKESSADLRRVMAIRALSDTRVQILVGVDDAIVEAIDAGAIGWIAGLVNAPRLVGGALPVCARGAKGRRVRALPMVSAATAHGHRGGSSCS